ncbi:hypothetical protein Tco_0295989 [Tanacetum coccineum]
MELSRNSFPLSDMNSLNGHGDVMGSSSAADFLGRDGVPLASWNTEPFPATALASFASLQRMSFRQNVLLALSDIGFIEEVIMKTIDYHLFDIVVEFHKCVFLSYLLAGDSLKSRGSIVSFREMITSQLQGKLRLYDEVRARTLFVLSSSNRGR